MRRYGNASTVEKLISRKIFQVATANPTRKIAEGNDMVKCGYNKCKNHLNGFFNPYNVPESLSCIVNDGKETFYCCEEHYDMCH
ncbi:MAG: hypothetical protein ACTSSE_19225 [Candidatus Thorarchaeota archaeon]